MSEIPTEPMIHDPIQKEHENLTTRVFNSKKIERRQNERTKKICQVCGDQALCYNFGAISCESCKAFFKRNACLKGKEYECPFQNECTITVKTRKLCQKCRLRKCFQVGMKPMTPEDQKREKRRRLLERFSGLLTMNTSADGETSSTGAVGVESTRHDTDLSAGGNLTVEPAFAHRSEGASASPFRVDGKPEIIELDSDSIHSVFAPIVPSEPTAQTPTTAVCGPADVNFIHPPSFRITDDSVEISFCINRSTLADILVNHNDRSEQAAALARVLMAGVELSSDTLIPERPIHPVQSFANSTNSDMTPYQTQTVLDTIPNDGFGTWTTEDRSKTSCYDGESQSIAERSLTRFAPYRFNRPDCQTAGKSDNSTARSQVSTTDVDTATLDKLAQAFLDPDKELPVLSLHSIYLELTHCRIEELLMVNQMWNYNTYNERLVRLASSAAADFTLEDYASIFSFIVQKFFAYYNAVSEFKSLPYHDQEELLTESIHELGLLRLHLVGELERKGLCSSYLVTKYFEFALAKKLPGGIYNETKELFSSFAEKFRSDATLILILSAVVLFNPGRSRVVSKGAVAAKRRVYLEVLRDYLDHNYGRRQTRWLYDYLITLIDDVSLWAKRHCTPLVLKFNPNTLELTTLQMPTELKYRLFN